MARVLMNPGTLILQMAKASPDDFLAGLKSLSNQERVEVDRKMRQLEDKHQDEFSKDAGRREQSRRGFLSTLGLGAAGVGAAVASKLLPGGKVIGEAPPTAKPAVKQVAPEVTDRAKKLAAAFDTLNAKRQEFSNPLREPYRDMVDVFAEYEQDQSRIAAVQALADKEQLNRGEMDTIVRAMTDAMIAAREADNEQHTEAIDQGMDSVYRAIGSRYNRENAAYRHKLGDQPNDSLDDADRELRNVLMDFKLDEYGTDEQEDLF